MILPKNKVMNSVSGSKAKSITPVEVRDLVRMVPPEDLEVHDLKSLLYVLKDFFFVGLFGFCVVVFRDVWWIALSSSVLLGMCHGSLMALGHDAGHMSLFRSPRLNVFFGHLIFGFVAVPYHQWRHLHDEHHRYTHLWSRDPSWHPLTPEEFKSSDLLSRVIYRLSRTWLPALASIQAWVGFHTDVLRGVYRSKFGQNSPTNAQLWTSTIVSLFFTIILIAVVTGFWGMFGFVFLYLIPQFIFHTIFSLAVLIHHTDDQSTFYSLQDWHGGKVRLDNTFNILVPAWFDFSINHLFWHVPHHISTRIPHYKLPRASLAIEKALGQRVQSRRLTWTYLVNVLSKCHLQSKDGRWLSFSEAARRE